MENQIKYTEEKVKFYLHAQINCHPSMKAFYQGKFIEWNNILKSLQNEQN